MTSENGFSLKRATDSVDVTDVSEKMRLENH